MSDLKDLDNMDYVTISKSLEYVTCAPYFWLTMGMTTAIAMFIGAIVYDGDLSTATKGMITLGSYLFFLIQTQIVRVGNTLSKQSTHLNDYMAIAATITIVIISIFWLAGMLFGVFISYLVRKHRRFKL